MNNIYKTYLNGQRKYRVVEGLNSNIYFDKLLDSFMSQQDIQEYQAAVRKYLQAVEMMNKEPVTHNEYGEIAP